MISKRWTMKNKQDVNTLVEKLKKIDDIVNEIIETF